MGKGVKDDLGAGLHKAPMPRGLRLRFGLLTGTAIALVALSALIQELQAASTAWIVGQSHWSRGQQRAVAALDRYLDTGAPQALAEAERALDVPLGDMEARKALERADPDYAAARSGFLRGGNAPGDIRRLMVSYRHGRDLAHFREASRLWQRTDDGLLELQALGRQIQAAHRAGRLDPATRNGLRQRLLQVDAALQELAYDFTYALARMASLVRIVTLVVVAVSMLLITLLAIQFSRRVRSDLYDEESRFRAAFYQASVGMVKLDAEGRIMEANPTLANLLKYPQEMLLRMRLHDLLEDGELVLDERGCIDWQRQLRTGEMRFVRADGSLMWGRWSGTAVPRGRQHLSVFAIVEDVTRNHTLAREVEHHASHDPLTGLVNRREIERLLEEALHRVRLEGGVHALCYLNLDHFKLVNDTVGHAAGDQLLRGIAEDLKAAVREGDWVGRLGADEFALFLAHANQDEAKAVLQRVIRAMAQSVLRFGDEAPQLSASVGIVEVSAEALDVNWLMSAADSACYAAKQAGRNRVHCFNEDRLALDERRVEAERLRQVGRAMSENRMVLYAQRIHYPAQPQRLCYEVLVRMRDAKGGIHAPGEFMPAVERYGMGAALDRCVLSMVFSHLRACPSHVRQLGVCNVNVSAQSIADPAFLAFVTDQLERDRVLARRLCFEITETAAIGNLAQARAFIEAVKAHGCLIALDDFGSGMSSFGYLRKLQADVLKIDGSFVRDMDRDPVSRAAVRAIAALGRELDLTVVAEWVETDEVAAQLMEMGVEGLQGYGLDRPVPLDRLTRSGPRAVSSDGSADGAGRA